MAGCCPMPTACAPVLSKQHGRRHIDVIGNRIGIGLSNFTIRQRFAGFERRDADWQVAEHSRDRSAIGAAHRIAIVFPEALAISGIIVLIRLAWGSRERSAGIS
jgi:hypothetical protein